MTRTLAQKLLLLGMLGMLAACADSSQNQQRASLASNDAQWNNLIAADTVAYVSNRNLIQMR